MSQIKNIVFDVGNVLVRWDPHSVVERLFSAENDPLMLTKKIFKDAPWYDLNLGKITEQQAIQYYHQTLNIEIARLELLMQAIKESLMPVDGSFNLVAKLHKQNYTLYLLTDNTIDIVAYLRTKYDFWRFFKGMISSAEVGHLKPSPAIYQCLLGTYQLAPQETLFLDDLLKNVEGAQAVGIHAVQFTTVAACIEDLKKFNIIV